MIVRVDGEVLSLHALLVQKYKYWRVRAETQAGEGLTVRVLSTYADVCWRMLTYAVTYAGRRGHHCQGPLAYCRQGQVSLNRVLLAPY